MAKRSSRQEAAGWAGKPLDKVLLLEVSGDWIKLLEVSGGRGGVTINRAHLEPVDLEGSVAESLIAAIRREKFSVRPVIACIPGQRVNVRLLELPSTDPVEIHDMVELQVGRQTPYSVSEILSSAKTLGLTRQGTYTRVMLSIVQRSLVRERYYAIEQAGLAAKQMTISSEGVLNWYLYRTRNDDPEQVTALLDVDSFFTHMVVVQHHKVIFTKSILWGAKQVGDGLEPFVQRVREAFQSCGEALRDTAIQSVTVSGAGGRMEGLVTTLGEALALPCQPADSLEDVRLDKESAKLRDERYAGVSLTALIGMALAPNLLDIHFVPDVVWMRGLIQERTRMWAGMAGFAAAVMLAASLYGMLATGYRLNRLKSLKDEADALQPRVVRVERMLEVIRASVARQDTRFLPANLLPEVHRCIPEGVYLDTLEIGVDREVLTMGGTAGSRRDIRDLIRMLEESPCFEGVEEGGRTAMDSNERFVFQVVGRFKREQRQ